MKIVIDIPEEVYKCAMDGTWCGTLYDELKNGVPVKPCEDCVSREAVAYMLDTMKMSVDETWIDLYRKALSGLVTLPPVMPERPRGEWIEISSDQLKEFGIFYPRGFRCSKCNRLHPHKSDYCEHCGSYNADIREVQDVSDNTI